MNKTRFWAIIALILFLGACTTPFRSDVTRFHKLTLPEGESFVIVAKNPMRQDSLELKSYGKIVSSYLRREGYIPAAGGEADLIVGIDFGISGPIERRRNTSYPFHFYGSFYFYGGRHWYPHPWYDPYFGPYLYHPAYNWRYSSYLYDPYDRTYLVYERVFEMVIKEKGGEVIFEGRAVSIGRGKELPKIMPYLIEALFVDFPGVDGSTEKVKIEPRDGGDY